MVHAYFRSSEVIHSGRLWCQHSDVHKSPTDYFLFGHKAGSSVRKYCCICMTGTKTDDSSFSLPNFSVCDFLWLHWLPFWGAFGIKQLYGVAAQTLIAICTLCTSCVRMAVLTSLIVSAHLHFTSAHEEDMSYFTLGGAIYLFFFLAVLTLFCVCVFYFFIFL